MYTPKVWNFSDEQLQRVTTAFGRIEYFSGQAHIDMVFPHMAQVEGLTRAQVIARAYSHLRNMQVELAMLMDIVAAQQTRLLQDHEQIQRCKPQLPAFARQTEVVIADD
ncbi:MAG: hypothetical protein AAGF24_09940 [Cyanobacteria bacterium P01_H01_bin.121]